MWPVAVDASVPKFDTDGVFTLGGMSDSVYEYLPKQYLLLDGALEQPRKMYEKFIKVAKEKLFFRPYNPQNRDILISGDARVMAGGKLTLKTDGQHLTCFAGGMIGIASKMFEHPEDLEIAKRLTDGCVWSYDITRTGIGPEIFSTKSCDMYGSATDEKCKWDDEKWLELLGISNTKGNPAEAKMTPHERAKAHADANRVPLGMTYIQDRKYILRPEAIESVFIMWRLTGDREWQEKAWRMFEKIERYTRTDIAASAIDDVMLGGATKGRPGAGNIFSLFSSNHESHHPPSPETFARKTDEENKLTGNKTDLTTSENPLGETEPRKTDSMESFWLAETLKYFYLIFADFDLVNLDEWILNTEAHPLRRP